MSRFSRSAKQKRRTGSRSSSVSPPVVYISHATINDVEVQRIAADLRERDISAYVYPFDTGGARVESGFTSEEPRTKVLALAVSSAMLESAKLRQEFDDVVAAAERNRSHLKEIIVLRLQASEHVPENLSKYRSFELFEDYSRGLARFVDELRKLGGRANVISRREVGGTPGPYTVEGTFEAARTGVDQLVELQRQIAVGHLDQRYLYFETQSALRWQRVAEVSTYLTAQRSMNLLVENIQAIVDRIASDNESAHAYSFINLGVGTGQKDFQVLRQLLQRAAHVLYFPVDDSFEMIRLTMRHLENLLSVNNERIDTHFIVDDFLRVDNYSGVIDEFEERILRDAQLRERFPGLESPTRVLGLLGGAIGNFEESLILGACQQLMDPEDYLLVGVEYIANRSDEQLIENYSDRRNKEFLYGPIGDLYGWPDDDDDLDGLFLHTCTHRPDHSNVVKSKTVTVQVRQNGHRIEVSRSTKYEPEEFERFLVDRGFEILNVFTTPEKPTVYGKYLLRLHTD